jgi:hypothetical protein
VLPQDGLEGAGVRGGVGGEVVDDVGQVGEEVALVLVREDGRHAGVVELDVLVGDAHEVHGGVLGHERGQGVGDGSGDGALRACVSGRGV